ncbi:MAG: hypothetical protein HY549_03615 [Elusimicrobia bacterium]|nr:hypothetical protein [Elusimicrobiota bacterium]
MAIATIILLAAGASAQVAEVKSSTVPPPGPGSIYTAEKVRDPFVRTASGGRAGAGKNFTLEDFNIHNLTLRAIMKDAKVDYALFSDNSFGVTFILRKETLYSEKGKPIPGVKGSIKGKQRSAFLMTQDGDVQTFRLGEEIKE